MTREKVLPLGGMVVLLALGYLLDKFTTAVKASISQTFQIYRGYVWLTLFEFLFAGMAILLVWLSLARSKRSFLVAGTFLVVGLICLARTTFFRASLLSIIPNPYHNLYLYQLQDLPFFQRIYAMVLWNLGHGHFLPGLTVPAAFQFFTRASVLVALLGVVKFFQKPARTLSSS